MGARRSGRALAAVRQGLKSGRTARGLLWWSTALGTSLAAIAASPAFAVNCTQPPSPAPITVASATTPISCTNTVTRDATAAGDNAIGITTTGDGNTIDIENSGALTTASTALIPGASFSQSTGARGIFAGTNGIGADITIGNTGEINSYSDAIKATDAAVGGTPLSSGTHITITNSATLTAGPNAEGIFARASYGGNNVIVINNSGNISTGASASESGTGSAIVANVGQGNGSISVTNSATLTTIGASAAGISAVASYYNGSGSSIVIDNKAGGTITASGADAYGIFGQAGSVHPVGAPANPDTGGTVQITNAATVRAGYIGVGAFTYGDGGNIVVVNHGNVTSGTGGGDGSNGVSAIANGSNATISVTNTGNIDTTAGGNNSIGIDAANGPVFAGSNLDVSVNNSGAITTGAESEGIFARSGGGNSSVTVINSGAITTGASTSTSGGASAIFADTDGDNGLVSVTNSGALHTVGLSAAGISAIASYYNGSGSRIVIDNQVGGAITTTGADAYGIFANAGSITPVGAPANPNPGGTIQITNAASINAGYVGVAAFTYGAGGNIVIANTGNITAGSGGYAKSYGISALANGGNTTVSITNSGAIDTTAGGAGSVGINAINGPAFNSGNLAISVDNSGTITTAADSEGIFARSGGLNANVSVINSGSITTGNSTSTSGGSTAIFADVDGANSLVTVTNNGALHTVGLTAAGISAIANYYNGSGGRIVIDNQAGGAITTTGADAYGIFANAGSITPVGAPANPNPGGTIQISNAATIKAGYVGIAAFTYGAGGNIVIANTGNITAGSGHYAASDGVNAVANGGNTTVSITNSGAIDTTAGGADSRGISAVNGPAFNAGNLDITINNSGAITTAAESEGIFARSGYGNSSVTVINSGSITTGNSTSTSGGASAIFADTDGGNGSVSVTNSGALHTIGLSAAGISAIGSYYRGSGTSVVVNNQAGGTITATGAQAYGIFAQAGSITPVGAPPNPDDGGTVQVTNAAAVHAGYIGIGAFTYGAGGNIVISNSGAVTSDTNIGIVAKANGAGGAIVITDSAAVTGALGGIEADAAGGSVITINAGGVVGAANNLAITSAAGAMRIENSGEIDGRVVLSNAGNTFNNNDGGVFRAYTDSSFGSGVDTLTNTGVIDASGDHFTQVPTSIHLNGLDTLINGSLGSGPGTITLVDGKAGDSLSTSGDFVGQGNSKLSVDVDLLAGTADTLNIGGNATGHTAIAVNLLGGQTGAPTSAFIPIVNVAGATSPGAFGLASPVNAGFFTYDLALEGHQTGLQFVGLNAPAFELPAGVTAAQDLWQDGADFWHDHMADVRSQVADAGRGGGLRYVDADAVVSPPGAHAGGLWLRAVGDWSNRDQTVSYSSSQTGGRYSFNLDRKQDTAEVLGGVDMGVHGVGGGDILFGAMGGYISSDLNFKGTGDHWRFEGGTVGGYIDYLNGGFYADGLVKADFLNVHIRDGQAGMTYAASSNATNVGVRADVGYRARMGWGGFIEPQGGIQWVHTQMDATQLFGDPIAFKDGGSGRARFGLRIGTDMVSGGLTVTPDLTASVWDRFGSDNRAAIRFPADTFTASDNAGNGVYGEVGAGVTLVGARNWSGVIRGSYRYGDRYTAEAVSAALRYSW